MVLNHSYSHNIPKQTHTKTQHQTSAPQRQASERLTGVQYDFDAMTCRREKDGALMHR